MAQPDADLRAEAQRLVDATTPGEWTAANSGERDQFKNAKVTVQARLDEDGCDDPTSEPQTLTVCYTPYDTIRYQADMQFIAAAPRLVRGLLAELATLTARIEAAEDKLGTVEGTAELRKMRYERAEQRLTEVARLRDEMSTLVAAIRESPATLLPRKEYEQGKIITLDHVIRKLTTLLAGVPVTQETP